MRLEGGGRRRSHRAAPMAEINIIPLVDVVLVLLIIFMATTAFIKESGLKMKLPAASTAEVTPEEKRDLTVVLTRDNKTLLDGREMSEGAIQAAFTMRARKDAQARVVIKGDESIPYRRVVRVMDMAKGAGLSRVALGTRLPTE